MKNRTIINRLIITFPLFVVSIVLISCHLQDKTNSTNTTKGWQIVRPSGGDGRLNAISFDKEIGWIVGSNGILLKTADQGKIWLKCDSPVDENFNALHFINSTSGWVVGDFGMVIRTTDSGKTWRQLPIPKEIELYGVHFLDYFQVVGTHVFNLTLCLSIVFLVLDGLVGSRRGV